MGNFDVEKTIVVPDSGGTGNNFLAGMLASACQSKGLDANAVMALCGNRNGSFGNGWDGIIALIVIAAIFGGNGNGLFGGNNNNSTERQMLMDAIQRNGVDISQLASTLNCSIGQVQAAIQQVASQVCNVGNQVGMTGQQIINSIQQGNMALTQQICNCCCDIKTGIKDQTCNIEKAIHASTESILAGQRAAEMREMQREISERDRRIAEQSVIINNAQQSAAFAQMIGQAVAPLNAGINSLNTEIAGIKCHLPETKVIPCGDNYVKVNTGFNIPLQVSPAAYGACGAFGGYGYPWGYGYNCGNNGGWG